MCEIAQRVLLRRPTISAHEPSSLAPLVSPRLVAASHVTALAIVLVAATLRPAEPGVLLVVAILCALPWSLALLLLDVGPGFADRAAVIVSVSLTVNTALIWGSIALLRARFRDRRGPRAHSR